MEVFFIVASVIIALVVAAFKKNDDSKLIKTLPQLKEDFNLQIIESKDPEILGNKLQGHYNGFDIHVRFQKKVPNTSSSEINSIIKIDLNTLNPYSYQIRTLHSPSVETFYDYFDINSTDPKFKRKLVFQKSEAVLMKNHALLKGSNWDIERAVLNYQGVNFLEDEDDLKSFKQLLQVITVVAKDLQSYMKTSASNSYPSFNKLGQALEYEAILQKDQLLFSTFQTTNLNMPHLLYAYRLQQDELLFLSLQVENDKAIAKFELRLKKDPKFQLKIFPDHTNMITSFLKGQDIEIRDEEFDQAFIIQSEDKLKAKQLLTDQNFRANLLELKSHELKWSLSRDQILFQVKWKDTDRELITSIQNVIASSIQLYENL